MDNWMKRYFRGVLKIGVILFYGSVILQCLWELNVSLVTQTPYVIPTHVLYPKDMIGIIIWGILPIVVLLWETKRAK